MSRDTQLTRLSPALFEEFLAEGSVKVEIFNEAVFRIEEDIPSQEEILNLYIDEIELNMFLHVESDIETIFNVVLCNGLHSIGGKVYLEPAEFTACCSSISPVFG